MSKSPYFFGTGITLGKLREELPTHNVDGTRYKTDAWLKECAVIDSLVIGKSQIWIPYESAQIFGTLKEIIWNKYEFKYYNFPSECEDWFIYEPYMLVDATIDGIEHCYYVYEYTFYMKQRRKTQHSHIDKIRKRGKQKFYSHKEMGLFKQQESIQNSINKRMENESKLYDMEWIKCHNPIPYVGGVIKSSITKKFMIYNRVNCGVPYHVYILDCNAEIKEGDWMLKKDEQSSNRIRKCYYIFSDGIVEQLMIDDPKDNNRGYGFLYRNECYKIVATTDSKLNSIPSISNDILKKIVEYGNVAEQIILRYSFTDNTISVDFNNSVILA